MKVSLLIMTAFGAVGLTIWMLQRRWLGQSHRKHVLKHGRPGVATVVEIHDTGFTENKTPAVRLRLRVQSAEYESFETSVNRLVSRVGIPRVGDTLPVMFIPGDPSKVAVVDGSRR